MTVPAMCSNSQIVPSTNDYAPPHRRMMVAWAEAEGQSGAIVIECGDLKEARSLCVCSFIPGFNELTHESTYYCICFDACSFSPRRSSNTRCCVLTYYSRRGLYRDRLDFIVWVLPQHTLLEGRHYRRVARPKKGLKTLSPSRCTQSGRPATCSGTWKTLD